MSTAKGTVSIVDDDDNARGMISMLMKSSGYATREFSSANDYLSSGTPSESPACILLDVDMPGINGLELQETLNKFAGRSIPIIFVSGHTDIATGIKAMKGGALDFLPKPLNAQDVIRAVQTALQKDMTAQTLQANKDLLEGRFATLTRREKQVFVLVVQGLLNKQVGARLGIKEKTIKVHRGKVMQKMEANSIADLVRFSADLNLSKVDINPKE